MSFRLPSQRLIALAAACLIAAQAILLPLSIAAANPLLSAICTSAPSGAGHQPAGSAGGCGCAAACGTLCCAPAALEGPGAADVQATPAVVQVLGPAVAVAAGVRGDDCGSHHPRGPPRA